MMKSLESSFSPDRPTGREAPGMHPSPLGEPRVAAREVRTADLGDARLVERARSGDDQAFAALVVRYERKLIRVLGRLVHDEELARDLAQETFWKVYNRLDHF